MSKRRQTKKLALQGLALPPGQNAYEYSRKCVKEGNLKKVRLLVSLKKLVISKKIQDCTFDIVSLSLIHDHFEIFEYLLGFCTSECLIQKNYLNYVSAAVRQMKNPEQMKKVIKDICRISGKEVKTLVNTDYCNSATLGRAKSLEAMQMLIQLGANIKDRQNVNACAGYGKVEWLMQLGCPADWTTIVHAMECYLYGWDFSGGLSTNAETLRVLDWLQTSVSKEEWKRAEKEMRNSTYVLCHYCNSTVLKYFNFLQTAES